MRDSLAKSLKGKGYTVTPVSLPPSEGAAAVRRKLEALFDDEKITAAMK